MPRGDGAGLMGMGLMIGGRRFCAGFTALIIQIRPVWVWPTDLANVYATAAGWARHKDPNIKGLCRLPIKRVFEKTGKAAGKPANT